MAQIVVPGFSSAYSSETLKVGISISCTINDILMRRIGSAQQGEIAPLAVWSVSLRRPVVSLEHDRLPFFGLRLLGQLGQSCFLFFFCPRPAIPRERQGVCRRVRLLERYLRRTGSRAQQQNAVPIRSRQQAFPSQRRQACDALSLLATVCAVAIVFGFRKGRRLCRVSPPPFCRRKGTGPIRSHPAGTCSTPGHPSADGSGTRTTSMRDTCSSRYSLCRV